LPRLQEMSVTGANYVHDKLSKTTYCCFIDDNLWQVCFYICSAYNNLTIVTDIHTLFVITRKLCNYKVVTRIIISVILLNTQDFSFIRLIACSICDLPSKLSYTAVAVSLISR
jgi:hypothetical protein